MEEWFARYESHATITDEQLDELPRPVFSVELTENPAGGRWCRITLTIEADDYTEAVRKAQRAYAQVASRAPAGTIGKPFRVTVEQGDAPTGTDLLSTSAVAARLGVSDARVRQLAQRPGFPKPLPIPGLAGALYRVAEIDAWAASWDRDNPGGRPRRSG